MARICNQPGCGRALIARGMCSIHYRAALAANPKLRTTIQTRETVLEAMPARMAAIIKVTGLCSETVRRTLIALRKDDLAHVGSFDPPMKFGDKFMPVYAAGPGKDAVLTPEMQDQQRMNTWRNGYHRRRLIEKTQALPKSDRWAAALMVGL
jgi:hypothetical protein